MVTLNYFTQCCFLSSKLQPLADLKQNASYMYIGRFRHFILFIFLFYILLSYCKQINLFFKHFKKGCHTQYFQRTYGSFSDNAGLC